MLRAVILGLAVLTVIGSGSTAERPIAIMYAFDAEGAALESRMAVDSVVSHLGRRITHGQLEGHTVILAESGIGMINAALTTQLLIDRYNPGAVLFSGIAGGIDSSVAIGDIVVCSLWVPHEYGYWGKEGLELQGTEVWVPSQDSVVELGAFPVDGGLYAIAGDLSDDSLTFEPVGGRIPRLAVGGTGTSGNSFIDSEEKRLWLSRETGALVVDMESAAVVQVCGVNGVACLVFRSASDLAGGSGSETAREQIREFFKVAAANSSAVVVAYLRKL